MSSSTFRQEEPTAQTQGVQPVATTTTAPIGTKPATGVVPSALEVGQVAAPADPVTTIEAADQEMLKFLGEKLRNASDEEFPKWNEQYTALVTRIDERAAKRRAEENDKLKAEREHEATKSELGIREGEAIARVAERRHNMLMQRVGGGAGLLISLPSLVYGMATHDLLWTSPFVVIACVSLAAFSAGSADAAKAYLGKGKTDSDSGGKIDGKGGNDPAPERKA